MKTKAKKSRTIKTQKAVKTGKSSVKTSATKTSASPAAKSKTKQAATGKKKKTLTAPKIEKKKTKLKKSGKPVSAVAPAARKTLKNTVSKKDTLKTLKTKTSAKKPAVKPAAVKTGKGTTKPDAASKTKKAVRTKAPESKSRKTFVKAPVAKPRPAAKKPAAAKDLKNTAGTAKTKPSAKKPAPPIEATLEVKTRKKTGDRAKTVKAPEAKKKRTVSQTSSPEQIAQVADTLPQKKALLPHIAKEGNITPVKTPLKIFLPGDEPSDEIVRDVVSFELPEEYGENELFVMVADPNIIFISWEIRREEILGADSMLSLRIYDVTGIEFDGSNAHSFIDLAISERIGSDFFKIKYQGREVVVEAGLLSSEGLFKPIIRSNKVSIPVLTVYDELGIAEKLSKAGMPIGY